MKIAIQMNAIDKIHISQDTTFALCLEAQKRGHTLFYYTPNKLSMRNDMVYAGMQSLTVKDHDINYYQLGNEIQRNFFDIDLILLRQDPPFNMEYITNTYFLERISENTLIVNDPFFIRNSPEKIFVSKFSDLIPETLFTKENKEVLSFYKEFKNIIIKPLYESGGSGVFHIFENDKNLSSLLELFEKQFPESYVVQKYLEDVKLGDKRIILVDGAPVGAINRFLANRDNRCNIHVGGRVEKAELNKRDLEICERISPFLKERNLFLVGIDIIGNYITEINVTSPTGIREIKNLSGVDVAKIFWENIENKVCLFQKVISRKTI